MIDTTLTDRESYVVAALAGGWVADAASLGLHWLYDLSLIHI